MFVITENIMKRPVDVYVSLSIENDFPNMKLQTEDKVHNLCS